MKRATSGLIVKLLLLGAVNGIGSLALPRLASNRSWVGFSATAIALIAINVLYLSRRRVAAKFLVPATIFLLLFQLYPVGFTAYTAFTNYGTGNVLSKQQAIDQIIAEGAVATGLGPSYGLAVLQNPSGDLRLLLTDETGRQFVATRSSLEPLDPANVTLDDQTVTRVGEYRRLSLNEVIQLGEEAVMGFIVSANDAEIRPQSLTSAAAGVQALSYDSTRDVIVDAATQAEFSPKAGTFTAADGSTLTPGFRTTIGWKNFTRSFTDSSLRSAFIRVFLWNYAFAFLTVFFDAGLGLLLAVVLNKNTLRGRKVYRSVLVLPYAMPSVMTILIWSQGLLNTGYGAINRAIGSSVGWLDNTWLARLSILAVNMWLGFGYKFLLFSSQLQSIPPDLGEAATVDGASARQTFRRITFPLLLSGIAPMLISSFAFNFNNAVLILALTGGGPPIPGSTSVAGQTDILMSYTYKVAFASGRGQDYGYATALTIMIFAMVAMISTLAFRATKRFEEI